jgi:hypothetical protein
LRNERIGLTVAVPFAIRGEPNNLLDQGEDHVNSGSGYSVNPDEPP